MATGVVQGTELVLLYIVAEVVLYGAELVLSSNQKTTSSCNEKSSGAAVAEGCQEK